MGNIMSSHQNQAKPNDSDLVILLRTGQKLQYKTQFSETAKLSIYLFIHIMNNLNSCNSFNGNSYFNEDKIFWIWTESDKLNEMDGFGPLRSTPKNSKFKPIAYKVSKLHKIVRDFGIKSSTSKNRNSDQDQFYDDTSPRESVISQFSTHSVYTQDSGLASNSSCNTSINATPLYRQPAIRWKKASQMAMRHHLGKDFRSYSEIEQNIREDSDDRNCMKNYEIVSEPPLVEQTPKSILKKPRSPKIEDDVTNNMSQKDKWQKISDIALQNVRFCEILDQTREFDNFSLMAETPKNILNSLRSPATSSLLSSNIDSIDNTPKTVIDRHELIEQKNIPQIDIELCSPNPLDNKRMNVQHIITGLHSEIGSNYQSPILPALPKSPKIPAAAQKSTPKQLIKKTIQQVKSPLSKKSATEKEKQQKTTSLQKQNLKELKKLKKKMQKAEQDDLTTVFDKFAFMATPDHTGYGNGDNDDANDDGGSTDSDTEDDNDYDNTVRIIAGEAGIILAWDSNQILSKLLGLIGIFS